jgi:hypothetical protein
MMLLRDSMTQAVEVIHPDATVQGAAQQMWGSTISALCWPA